MIITLRDTQTSTISEKIDTLHEERGEVALGRVLTLLILTDEDNLEAALRLANEASLDHPCRVIAITPSTRRMTEPEGRVLTLLILTDEDNLEAALRLANEASLDHPCRVIAITPSTRRMTEPEEERTYLDAEVRIGADAGAGEIIVLRPRGGLIHHQDTLVIPLLVPDAPVRSAHRGRCRRRRNHCPAPARRSHPPSGHARHPPAGARRAGRGMVAHRGAGQSVEGPRGGDGAQPHHRRDALRRRTSWGRWRTAASPTRCARRTRCARWRTCAATGLRRTSTCRGRA